ncbi:MAG: membrane protein insertase YidC [Pseudomonadota bacterium]
MEIRRTLILIALAIVSYFLFLSWQRDYAAPATQASTQSLPTTDSTAASTEIPSAPVASKGDVPVAAASVVSANSVALAEVSDAKNSSVITVKTDVLALKIDLQGGDITQVALPKYTKKVDSTEPLVLMDQSQERTYIAQSGLISVAGQSGGLDDKTTGRPSYRAAQNDFVLLESEQALQVVLKTVTADGVEVQKIFEFKRGDYRINVRYVVKNGSPQTWTGLMFGQLKRDNSTDPSADTHSFGMVTFLGGAWWTPEKTYNKLALSKFAKEPLNTTVTGGWVAMVQHYFVTAWIPNPKTQNVISSRVSSNGSENFIGFTAPAIVVAPGAEASTEASLYAGPKIQDRLKELSPGLELTVDYGWLWPVAQFLFWLLKSIHGFLGNWGWSIVVLTVLVKAAFFHLSATSYRSMANMRRVMPEMQRMKEQFGSDRAKLSQAMMELYKKEKINPLGGCLPILVQMPVFIALYWTLMESVELRHAGWILWIKDLSLLDPYYILPLLMGVTMYVQQSLNPAPQDPTQAKMMKFMPVIFTVFFLWFPAGLVLYWLSNNLLSIAQQWAITRQIEKAAAK